MRGRFVPKRRRGLRGWSWGRRRVKSFNCQLCHRCTMEEGKENQEYNQEQNVPSIMPNRVAVMSRIESG